MDTNPYPTDACFHKCFLVTIWHVAAAPRRVKRKARDELFGLPQMKKRMKHISCGQAKNIKNICFDASEKTAKKEHPDNANCVSRHSTGGEEGIRTLVGLPPNGFQEVAHPSRLIPDNLQNAPKFTSFSHFIGHLPENCEKNAR